MTPKTPLSTADQTHASDPEASLRETLRQEIDGAQADLDASIHALQRAGDGQSLLQAKGLMQGLSSLQLRLALASGPSHANIHSEIRASIAATQALVQLALGTTGNAQTAEAALQVATQAARRDVSAMAQDLFEKKVFDPYLRFTSTEDEEAYRKREAERQKYIQTQLATGTPEGVLNASAATVAQLNDAEAHGAASGPKHKPMKTMAEDDFAHLRNAAKAAGISTDEADRIATAGAVPSAANPQPAIAPPVANDLADVAAQFRSAGVIGAPDGSGHGVTKQVAAITPASRVL